MTNLSPLVSPGREFQNVFSTPLTPSTGTILAFCIAIKRQIVVSSMGKAPLNPHHGVKCVFPIFKLLHNLLQTAAAKDAPMCGVGNSEGSIGV